jgi:hypothetical protein
MAILVDLKAREGEGRVRIVVRVDRRAEFRKEDDPPRSFEGINRSAGKQTLPL